MILQYLFLTFLRYGVPLFGVIQVIKGLFPLAPRGLKSCEMLAVVEQGENIALIIGQDEGSTG